jgi:hypothetical protein
LWRCWAKDAAEARAKLDKAFRQMEREYGSRWKLVLERFRQDVDGLIPGL